LGNGGGWSDARNHVGDPGVSPTRRSPREALTQFFDEVPMSPRPSPWLALVPLLLASPVRAQGADAQSRFLVTVPAIDFLLAHGAPLEARNRTGFTALHHAAEAGSLAAARALLAAGADRNTVNEAGRKPVETARLEGHEEMARLLQEAAD